jgi:hypothetical protein
VADPGAVGDAGVPHGQHLLRFATAAQRDHEDLAEATEALRAAVGDDGLVEAAATVSVFNGLVRVADGTGIQLDEGVAAYTADYRDRLGLNRYQGARNTPTGVDRELSGGIGVRDLFA